MIPDNELLRQYAEHGDQAAFADLVRRHTDLVYSIAVRVAIDPQLAEDATQVVFTKLARQARALLGYPTLVGWLHTTARYSAINLIRGEERRRTREQEAAAMQHDSIPSDAQWKEIRPLLDEAVGRLSEGDRQAVLLRYFNGLNHQEVGSVLGLTENSANKRIERALEKLRGYFASRGVKASSTLLAVAITANSVQAAPVGLAEKVTPASLAGAGGTLVRGPFLATLLAFFMHNKIKTVLAIATVFVGVTVWWYTQSAIAASEKIAQTASPASLIEQPKLPPATPKPETATPPPETADPHDDLTTAITDMARLIRNGDTVGLMKIYTEPDKLNPETLQQMESLPSLSGGPVGLRVQRMRNIEALAYEDLLTQTPSFNAAGDEATYQYRLPLVTGTPITSLRGQPGFGGKIPTLAEVMSPISAEKNLSDNRVPFTFIKINGKWYRKVYSDAAPPPPPPSPSSGRVNRGGN